MSRRLLVSIDYDPDTPESPLEESGFKLYQFNSRRVSYCARDALPFDDDELAELIHKGHAYWLDYFEHGNCLWSLHGGAVQCRWDTAPCAGLLVLEEPESWTTDPAQLLKCVRGLLESYTQWCNGEVYCIDITDEEGNDVDSLGWLIGDDSVLDALKEMLEPTDDVILLKSDRYDASHLVDKLPCRARHAYGFPVAPLPEYAI